MCLLSSLGMAELGAEKSERIEIWTNTILDLVFSLDNRENNDQIQPHCLKNQTDYLNVLAN